jgi:hypothetical protein
MGFKCLSNCERPDISFNLKLRVRLVRTLYFQQYTPDYI